MTPQDFLDYYAGLLLLQYKTSPKAIATVQAYANLVVMPQTSVQDITFSLVPASGSFVLQYGTLKTVSIAWDASISTIQSNLQALSGLSAVTVAGSISSQLLTITFTGVAPPATLLSISSNSLLDSHPNSVGISVFATDIPLPAAIQQAYNIDTAVGMQLDVLGKYCGASRYGYNFSGPMTLTDVQLRILIRLLILQNNSGSSLADIQHQLFLYFPGEISVFDHQDMRMSYFFDTATGSDLLAEFIVKGGFLPRPMGVQLAVLTYAPVTTTFFGFRTYEVPPYNVVGFNNYSNQYPGTWLSYQDGIFE